MSKKVKVKCKWIYFEDPGHTCFICSDTARAGCWRLCGFFAGKLVMHMNFFVCDSCYSYIIKDAFSGEANDYRNT